jgi:hypothetical protein
MTRNANAIVDIAKRSLSLVECALSQPQPHTHTHTHTPENLPEKDKYTVEIDFDEASREWKKNKKSIGSGSYKYIGCIYKYKNGHNCGRSTVNDTDYCAVHLVRINIDKYL